MVGNLGSFSLSVVNETKQKTNSVAFSPQANYTTERLPLVGEI
jgi:hypothetical protein